MRSAIIFLYSAFSIFAPHGAAHCLMLYSRHGRKNFLFSSESLMSMAHVLNLNIFWSTPIAARKSLTAVNGPKSFDFSFCGFRVMYTPG